MLTWHVLGKLQGKMHLKNTVNCFFSDHLKKFGYRGVAGTRFFSTFHICELFC